ncbi:MAG: citryl-CoA lyase [Pseudomonadota bacterium]
MTDLETHDGDVAEWWQTAIIEMEPGRIALRGTPIQELIGAVSFADMIWRMLVGREASAGQIRLFEAALVAAVDHGPQAPSVAAARMAATCGVGINSAMATGINLLGDVHGGAGQQAVALYADIAERLARKPDDHAFARVVGEGVAAWQAEHGKFVPGFGHRFHKPVDPRAPRLMALVREEAASGAVTGRYADIGEAVEAHLTTKAGRPIPMNIDGATAVIFSELGLDAHRARAAFCLSRAVGIAAHAAEQMDQGGRNKGPTPPGYRWAYTGPETDRFG